MTFMKKQFVKTDKINQRFLISIFFFIILLPIRPLNILTVIKSVNMAHFVAFLISFKKFIPFNTPLPHSTPPLDLLAVQGQNKNYIFNSLFVKADTRTVIDGQTKINKQKNPKRMLLTYPQY